MKKIQSFKILLILIALLTTAHISYGQVKPDSTNQFSIKQSLKCFQEQKSLKVIIEQKDSINIMITAYYQKTKIELQKEVVKQNNEIAELKDKNETLKGKNYLLITALVIETIIIGIAVIF